MKKYIITLAALAMFMSSCAGGQHLRTEAVSDKEQAEGTVKLIVHGARFSEDLETLAILDLVGDEYELKPVSPEFRYKVYENLPVQKALEEAYHYIADEPSVTGTWLARVLNTKGEVIGYELRPLYMPTVYGWRDILFVRYVLMADGEVSVYIRLKESVRRSLRDESGSTRFGY